MCLGRECPHCGGALVDVLLDWEDELRDYEEAVDLSERSVHSKLSRDQALFLRHRGNVGRGMRDLRECSL